jgi:isopentenyldiphosphate isomerase
MPKIAIVNEKDEIIGAAEKSEARKNGQIHRLVRILLCGDDGRILLQKRHPKAQDAPDKWDYSVGGHVDEGEDYVAAAIRELEEELNLSNIVLKPLFKFYAEKVVNGERLRRFSTVFSGQVDAKAVRPNLNELGGIRWFTKSQVAAMIRKKPEDFTAGLRDYYSQTSHYFGD